MTQILCYQARTTCLSSGDSNYWPSIVISYVDVSWRRNNCGLIVCFHSTTIACNLCSHCTDFMRYGLSSSLAALTFNVHFISFICFQHIKTLHKWLKIIQNAAVKLGAKGHPIGDKLTWHPNNTVSCRYVWRDRLYNASVWLTHVYSNNWTLGSNQTMLGSCQLLRHRQWLCKWHRVWPHALAIGEWPIVMRETLSSDMPALYAKDSIVRHEANLTGSSIIWIRNLQSCSPISALSGLSRCPCALTASFFLYSKPKQ